MTKMRAILTAGLVVLALAGCTGPAAPEAEDTQTEAQKNGFRNESEWFLHYLKGGWAGDALPSDAELLALADNTCQGLDAGTARTEIVAVSGATKEALKNNNDLMAYAIMAICPQHA